MHIGGGAEGFFFAGFLLVGALGFFDGAGGGFFFAGFFFAGFFFVGFFFAGFFFAGFFFAGFFFAGFFLVLVLELEEEEGGLVEVGRMRGGGVAGMRREEIFLSSAPVIFMRGGSWTRPSFCCHSVLCLAISDAMEIPAVCVSGSSWLSGFMREETYACRSLNSDESSAIGASMGLADEFWACDGDAQFRMSKMRRKQPIISIL